MVLVSVVRYVEGNRAAWRALEDAYKAGKLKVIGISNFQIGDIESLLQTAEIKPMVNQILLHISNTPLELMEYCQKNGIAVEAYSPIAHGEILNQPEIKAMAEKYGVTVPQLCIRYTLQLGAISLPKTANPEHMKTNAEVDFEISAQDMEVLKNFKKIESYGASSVSRWASVSPKAKPFCEGGKSVQFFALMRQVIRPASSYAVMPGCS